MGRTTTPTPERHEANAPIVLSEIDGLRLRVIEGDLAQLQVRTAQIRAEITAREQALIAQRDRLRQDLTTRYPGFDPLRHYLLAADGVTLAFAPEPPGAARPVLPRVTNSTKG